MNFRDAVKWFAERFHERIIPSENGKPYLSRYCVAGWYPGSKWGLPFNIYIHNFHQRDLDPAPHNHPWKWAVSVVLNGAYLETRNGEHITRQRFSVGVLRTTDYHRIRVLNGDVWTLFITGPKFRSWGFQVPGRGFVPWRDRLKERGTNPEY